MSEGLDDFIRNRRKEFDEFEAPEHLWSRIETDLDAHQRAIKLRGHMNLLFRIAAIFIVVIAAGLIFLSYEKSRPVNISRINPELAREQVHYASMIQIQLTELEEIKEQEPKLYREFSSELIKLDRSYQKLKKDLSTSPNQEVTLKAMVLNLQIQSRVLNEQLNIIEQVKKLKNNQNESQGI